jgi:hypothetical protein
MHYKAVKVQPEELPQSIVRPFVTRPDFEYVLVEVFVIPKIFELAVVVELKPSYKTERQCPVLKVPESLGELWFMHVV